MLKVFHCLEDVRWHHVNFFLFLSLLCLYLIGFPSVVSAQVVDIPDPNLRAAINEALDKAPDDAITRAEMETLDYLWASYRDITDLTGIAFAINLTSLYLYGNSISDISPLSSLTNLTRLGLDGNSISDISPLSSLTNLITLNLYRTSISDISPLSSLTNLTWIGLGGNSISDISPLSSLTNLTWIGLGGNSISDISPLSSLTNLTDLELWENNISDISPLSSLTNLRTLNLNDNNISNILPLIALTKLSNLHIRGNNISDIGTIERLITQGTRVYFRDNPAFETPGPKIEDGWIWLMVPAWGVRNGFEAAVSGRDFLSEASIGAVTEADVAVNGARAGTRVGNSVWTPARLDATNDDNLNALGQNHNLGIDIAFPVANNVVPNELETPQEIRSNERTSTGLDATDPDNLNVLIENANLEAHIPFPVAYGVVSIQSEIPQQTRVYIGGGPVKVYLNGTLVYRDINTWFTRDYETAVPVTLNAGKNLLLIVAYRLYPWSRWSAYFGFQDDTVYTLGTPGAGILDVNGDGQINVIDLMWIAISYGIRGDGLPADVNADGIVNVQDFAMVAAAVDAANRLPQEAEQALFAVLEQAGEIEDAPAAPMEFRMPQHALSRSIVYSNVAAALADARILAATDARLRKGVAHLETLLALLTEMNTVPETTALLPNYPNPFNPETWIPYQLAEEGDVSLQIYSVNGTLIRTFALGYQPAGIYQRRSRAAYWDGRNQIGEPVASGVYFYTLTAGDFTATRKLLIRK